MEEYLDMNLKYSKNFDKKILMVSFIKEKIDDNQKAVDQFLDKYVEILEKQGPIILMVDVRAIREIDFSFVWKNASNFDERLKKIEKEKLLCEVVIMENKYFKNMADAVHKIYPPKIPLKICSDNNEALKFIKSII